MLPLRHEKLIARVILTILCTLFTVQGILGINSHTSTKEFDTVAYLSNALEIKHIGLSNFIGACINGTYRLANRHPLYLILLSPITAHSLNAFVNAKILTFIIGLLFLIFFFCVVRNLYGIATASLAGTLLIINITFIRLTTMVACESLLVLFFFITWFLMLKGMRDGGFLIAAGITAALTYLTKGTGILTIPIFCCTFFVLAGKHIPQRLKQKTLWGFFAAFLLVASPYIIRNIVVYQNPLYSINQHHLWIDSWQEIYVPDFYTDPPTLTSYIAKHSFPGVMRIAYEAFFKRGAHLMSGALQPIRFWTSEGYASIAHPTNITLPWLWTVCLIGLFIYGLIHASYRREKVLTFFTISIIYIFVSWYSKMAAVTRFFLPIVPFVLLYASHGIILLCRRVWNIIHTSRTYMPHYAAGAYMIFISFFTGTLIIHPEWEQVNIRSSYSFPKSYPYIIMWLAQQIAPEEHIFASNDFAGPLFYFGELSTRVHSEVWPEVEAVEDMNTYITQNNIRYGLLDAGTFSYRFTALKDYFGFDNEYGFVPKKGIPGWKLVGHDPEKPFLFLIYRFNLPSVDDAKLNKSP